MDHCNGEIHKHWNGDILSRSGSLESVVRFTSTGMVIFSSTNSLQIDVFVNREDSLL